MKFKTSSSSSESYYSIIITTHYKYCIDERTKTTMSYAQATTTPAEQPAADAEEAAVRKQCPFPVKCCANNKTMNLAVDDATAFNMFRIANGAVIMSNVFLSRSLIKLAERAAGCLDDDEGICELTIYGFRPSSLVTLIGTVSGLLAAFLLPIVGAIVDYTKHRKLLGLSTAVLLISVQAAQIYTVQSTWFVMAILQAINSFFYQALTLSAYAYLPEIKQIVGEATMIIYSSRFYTWMFTCEVLYLVLITAVSFVLENDDVVTAHVGQAVDVGISGFFYTLAFYFFTKKPARRQLPQGDSLLFAGFQQVFKTSVGICKYYPSTLGFFMIAIVFAEAGANSFTIVSVTFLVEYGFTTTQTGIVFLTVLIFCTVGTFFASYLMKKVGSPVRCMQLNFIAFIVVNFAAFPSIPHIKNLVYPAGALWGFMLGWFYPTELQLYASLMPKGQEAELAGFYLYCTQVMGWLPPLIFTIMNESPGVELYWGGVHLNIYFFISFCLYSFLPKWEECVEITSGPNKMIEGRNMNTEEEEDDV